LSATHKNERPPNRFETLLRPTAGAIRVAVGAVAFAPLAGLGAESDELRTLVVTAGGFEQEIVNAPASITVVT
jgi:outer membrane receptor for ferrienterochelin and colicins